MSHKRNETALGFFVAFVFFGAILFRVIPCWGTESVNRAWGAGIVDGLILGGIAVAVWPKKKEVR